MTDESQSPDRRSPDSFDSRLSSLDSLSSAGVSEPTPPRRAGRRARTAALIFVAAVAFLAYARLLLWHASFAVGGSDSSGYVNTARLITAGRIVEPVAALKQLDLPDGFLRVFLPLGFVPGARPGTMAPYYPPGLPLQFAFAGIVAGWNYGPFVVSPFAALVSLLLVYKVARELGLSRLFAAAGAAVLALCPVFLFQAEQPMSDVVATMWSLAAVLCALRSRRRDAWAAGAGAAFGMAVLVRPADLLLLIPLLFALRLRVRSGLFFVLGAAPFAAFLLAWNTAAYGGPFRTGYSGDLAQGLAFANLPMRFRHYGLWLVKLLSPLVPAGWLLLWADRRVTARDRALLVSWFSVFFLFYCLWGAYEAWWYTRYLLPGVPAMIVASLIVARDGLHVGKEDRGVNLRRVAAVLAFAAVLAVEHGQIRRLGVLEIGEGEKVYPDTCRLAESKLPPGSLLVSMQMSGAIRYYTALTPVRWDWIEPGQAPVLREHARARGRALYALLAPYEVERLQERLPGAWTKIGIVRDVTLWRAD